MQLFCIGVQLMFSVVLSLFIILRAKTVGLSTVFIDDNLVFSVLISK